MFHSNVDQTKINWDNLLKSEDKSNISSDTSAKPIEKPPVVKKVYKKRDIFGP